MISAKEETYGTVGQIKPEKPKLREWVKPAWFLFTVGWYVALSLIVPTGIGFWLDRPDRFDTHPLLTFVGFALGTVIAFSGLYLMLRRFYMEQKQEQEKNKRAK